MPAAYGLTAAGFVTKPLSAILASIQSGIWSAPSIGPDLDLSPQTPDGQIAGVYANDIASVWELIQIVYNQYNREDAEGAALDNIGDLVGIPREGQTYTQVYCTCGLNAANAPYAAGSLVANIAGFPAQTFSNVSTVPASAISGGSATVLFQSTTIGPTPAVNPGTLTAITTPVTGWSSVTNPAVQSQTGQAQETDAAYGPRQEEELAVEGSCNPSATVAAIAAYGAAQQPPITISATVFENTAQPPAPITIGTLTIQPNQYAVYVFSASAFSITGLGQVVWIKRPSGNLAVGTTTVTIQDPVLGQESISYNLVTGVPLFINIQVAILPGQVFSSIAANIRTALVNAAIAPTLASGLPPAGQLMPGSPVIGSQLTAVIMSVPGVADLQSLTFGLASFPTNTAPISIPLNEVATILASTVGTNVNIVQGTYP